MIGGRQRSVDCWKRAWSPPHYRIRDRALSLKSDIEPTQGKLPEPKLVADTFWHSLTSKGLGSPGKSMWDSRVASIEGLKEAP